MKSLAETLQINNLENTKMLDGNTAFIQKCFNPVVSNQEMFYDNFKTLVLIPEQKELVLNHAKLWGRLYPFWSTFDTFDVMESNNFFALDNLSGKDGEYLYEIQKWLDENLKQDWKFADFMSVDSV